MKKLMIVLLVTTFASCGGNDNKGETVTDTSTAGSSMLNSMSDTTSVIGSNKIGEGSMPTDKPVEGANASGK